MDFQTFNEAVISSLEKVWDSFAGVFWELIGGLVVFIIGVIIASFLRRIVQKLISLTKIDKAIEGLGVVKRYEEAGMKVSFSAFIGWLVKWFVIVATLLAVADIWGLARVSKFLEDVYLYIPNVIVAVVLLAVGILVGTAAYKLVSKSVKASEVLADSSSGFLAAVSKWAIVIFAVMAALNQLGVASRLIEIGFTGIVAMFALAGGLAFGLGGQDKAAEWLEKLETEVTSKKR